MVVRVSIDALERLEAAAGRFEQDAQTALTAAEHELQAAEQALHRRLLHWQGEVAACRERLASAEAALSACRASGFYDPETGVYIPPDCSREEMAVHQAQAQLAEAERELTNVELWIDTVRREATGYRDQVAELSRTLGQVLPSGRSFLRGKVTELRKFIP